MISTFHPTKCDTLIKNTIYFSQLRNAVNSKSPIKFMNHRNNVFLFDHEKVIQLKSNYNPTCSYEQTLSFLYDKKNQTEKRSLYLGTENRDYQSAKEDALEKGLQKKRKAILPKFRVFPFKALSDLSGSSIPSSVSNSVSVRSINRDILVQDLHNILDTSINSSSDRSTSSKTHSFHSLNGNRGTGDEAQTSAQDDEQDDGAEDGADDDGEGSQGELEEEPQEDDSVPDDSIESLDSIESQPSNQDYEVELGAGQHIPDHDDELGQEAGQSMVPPSSMRNRDAAQKSIGEEVRESDKSPQAGSPLCGTLVARPVRTAPTKKTGAKQKPVVSVSVRAPRMKDMNIRSAPSTKISVKLPFQSAEGGPDKK